MGSSVYGTAISGLTAAQIGLSTTGHNITNANTPGYNRQIVVQTTNLAQYTGSGAIGKGVHVAAVRRLYEASISRQLLEAQTDAAELASHFAQIQQISNLVADPSAGLSPALQDFFGGVSDVATNPASAPARQAVLSSAESLVGRFRDINQRLDDLRAGVDSTVENSVTMINAYATQIAKFNEDIPVASSVMSGQPPNDLLDQRDQLVTDLNKIVRASAVQQNDGSYNVFIGNGQALVVGRDHNTLSATVASNDPTRLVVSYSFGGITTPLAEDALVGGTLGGAMKFRSETLDYAQNALGRVAIGLADTFNAQHKLGQDLNGALGGDFFAVSGPVINIDLNNTGNASISATIASDSALTTSDYDLAFDGTNYSVRRVSDGNVRTFASLPQTVDGVTLSVQSGAMAAGDHFLILPTRYGARNIAVALSDTSKIAAAAPFRTSAPVANLGSGKISAGGVTANTSIPLVASVTLTYSQPTNQFTVAGAVPAVAAITFSAGSTISINGLDFVISGTPANGDTFILDPNAGAIGDNRNGLALAALRNKMLLAGGTATYQSAYSQFVGDIGNKTRELEVTSKAQDNLVEQTDQARQTVSGVNLDEEAGNLIRYQQAYQAASKMVQIANEMFKSILDLAR